MSDQQAGLIRIGSDVGGTDTDTVPMEGIAVLETVKRPMTPDIGSRIVAGPEDLAAARPGHMSRIAAGVMNMTGARSRRRVRTNWRPPRRISPAAGWRS